MRRSVVMGSRSMTDCQQHEPRVVHASRMHRVPSAHPAPIVSAACFSSLHLRRLLRSVQNLVAAMSVAVVTADDVERCRRCCRCPAHLVDAGDRAGARIPSGSISREATRAGELRVRGRVRGRVTGMA